MASKRGRKPTLNGRLARQGAAGLKLARLALDEVASVPPHFGQEAADAYALLVTELAEANALARVDVPLVEMAARAWERWRSLDEMVVAAGQHDAPGEASAAQIAGGEVGNKGFLSGLAQARAAAAKELRVCLAELGLTPSARMKTAGAAQSNFFDVLETSVETDDVDPFASNVVSIRGSQ